MGRTAFIFPGQGSQYVGMGRLLWERSDDVRRLYRDSSERAGFDVAGLSFEGPKAELDGDVAAQLAVYVCNEAHRRTALGMGMRPSVVTGYSLGFYSALVAAGCMEFEAGMDAVRTAGELAVEASARRPGTMGAIIGLSLEDVESVCAEASKASPVWVSNVNAARQILVSGEVSGVEKAVELAAARGALKAYGLEIGAAYHSPLMEPVAAGFSAHVKKMRMEAPGVPLISYLDAGYLEGVDAVRETVGSQIARRVMWKDTVQRLINDGVTGFVEVGPGSALMRMVRWVDRSVKSESTETMMESGTGASDRA